MDRANGTVKWFSQEKGFGFIQRDGGADVFVHFTSIQDRGFRTLEQGESVEFDIIEEPKGLKAANVVRLNPPAGDAQPQEARGGYGGGAGYGGGNGFGGADRGGRGGSDDDRGGRGGGRDRGGRRERGGWDSDY
jgi:CspA family cold shock protein